MEHAKDITYCSNTKCKRDCERNISHHNFNNEYLSISDFSTIEDFTEDSCEYYMVKEDDVRYKEYDTWKDFAFRPPVYFDGHIEPDIYDLVKYENHKPYKVMDLRTGEYKISTRSCFSIGFMKWNPKEKDFEFESCGLRYLEYREDGLEKFILDFAERERQKRID